MLIGVLSALLCPNLGLQDNTTATPEFAHIDNASLVFGT